VQLPIRAIEAGRGFAVNRHARNTLRIRGVNLAREDIIESGPRADLELRPNMVCEGCAEKISTALSSVPGVREVKSKVPQKHVSIE
jgi:P-type Cu+ transporter